MHTHLQSNAENCDGYNEGGLVKQAYEQVSLSHVVTGPIIGSAFPITTIPKTHVRID